MKNTAAAAQLRNAPNGNGSSSARISGASTVGTGKGAGTPKSNVSSSKYDVNITFCGVIPNAVLPINFYSGADFFLTASESETFGITLVEALGCNVLPIMPRCPVFDEFYGELFELI